MADLDPRLQVELLKWRAAQRDAEKSGRPAEERQRIADRTISVFVRTTLDDATLTSLGLDVELRNGVLVTGVVALRDAERLIQTTGVTSVALDHPVKSELNESVPQIRAPGLWNGSPSYKGRNVIIGIIDTGIDIFHDSFRKADRSKTRILSIWDQKASGGAPPAGFTCGVEYSTAEIEDALEDDVANPGTATFPHTDGEFVDGERVETGGHGTHVASIAAGDGSPNDECDPPFTFVGVAPEADLIVVRKANSASKVLAALKYIFERATALNRPAVVNMSFGWNLGAHDGTAQLDVWIDDLLNPGGAPAPGRAVVKSAGNERNKGRHARKTIVANGSVKFDFEIEGSGDAPEDVEEDQFEVWFDAVADLTLTIEGPATGGVTSATIPPAGDTVVVSGSSITVSSTAVAPNGQKHLSIEIAASSSAPVAQGPWSFRLAETSGNAATIDIWIERDEGDPCAEFVDAAAEPENTVSIPGNCRSVITVGSYDPGDISSLADSSSWGLPAGDLAPGQPLKPDIVAPGLNIMAAASGAARLPPPCSACCNYLHAELDGTSMAAPHVTGVVALMFEKNRNLTYEQVRAHLQAAARRDEIPAADVPPALVPAVGIGTPGQPDFLPIHQNHKWGAGRLDALVAVNTVPAAASGGGGGPTIVDAGAPAIVPSVMGRVRPWTQRFADRPAFQLAAALVSTHVDEVRRLIDTNKRVAVVWRRGGGPLLVRHVLHHRAATVALLPAAIGEFSIAALLERLMNVLSRFGSDALRADVVRWRAFVLAAPGSDLDTLDTRLREVES